MSDLSREDPATLIDMIEVRYHAAHRRELPELIRMARKLEAVHATCPAGLADLVERIGEELESHMRKEEQVLFPLMSRGGHPMIRQPIAVMRHEHVAHDANLADLETLANGFVPPADACGTWRALYAGLKKLHDDVQAHIRTENEDLFPRFA